MIRPITITTWRFPGELWIKPNWAGLFYYCFDVRTKDYIGIAEKEEIANVIFGQEENGHNEDKNVARARRREDVP